MSDLQINVIEIGPDESPTLKLYFDDSDASFLITLDFEGKWADMFEKDVDEVEARHGFAGELFNQIINMFK